MKTIVYVLAVERCLNYCSSVDNARLFCFLSKADALANFERLHFTSNCLIKKRKLTTELTKSNRVMYALVNKTTAYKHIKDEVRKDDNNMLYVITDKLFAKAIANQLNLKIVEVNLVK